MVLGSLSFAAEFFLLIGGVLLAFGGATLIGYAVRMRREELTHRVDLVMPRLSAAGMINPQSLERAVLPQVWGGMPVRDRREVIRRLSVFKVPARRAIFVFSMLRFATVVIATVLAVQLATSISLFAGQPFALLLLCLIFGIGGWFLPAIVIERLVKARSRYVTAGLPDALELLVVCVEAGLSLEDGLERIIVEMRHSHPALAEELALTAADLKVLPSREQSLRGLADRINTPQVRSVVTTLSQTMRYGTPLAQALRTVSSEMRNDAIRDLEERANRLPTLLTLPMMLFIMPTIFLIIGGPAALRVIDTFLR